MFTGVAGHHFLPSDGEWHRTEWWRTVTQECAPPEVVSAAEEALLRVFSPEWARDLAASEEATHPFEWLWVQRGGIPQLLKLGHSLVLLDSPEQIVADIRERSRFQTRISEAWAGAFMRAQGANVHYLEAGGAESAEAAMAPKGSRIPEFIAVMGDAQFAVEVKHLDMGEKEKEHWAVSSAFEDGFRNGEFEAGLPHPGKGSVALLTFPPDVIDALHREEFEAAKKTAAERGFELGRRRVKFMRTGPADGRYPLAPGLEVLVGAEYSGGSEGSVPFPTIQTYIDRLSRNQLKDSVRKFEAWGLTGVVVLLRPWWPRWPPPLVDAARDLLARRKRYGCIAAIMFVDERPELGMFWLRDHIHLLPGPAWEDLPEPLRGSLPSCEECGQRHLTFDLLSTPRT